MQINEEIRDAEVRLIDENGQQLGIMDVREAQRLADERGLDLVKVSQNVPPTCKLMDYSKYRYDMLKREKEQKRNQKIIEIKEIRLSATIDVHDMEVKAKQCDKFLRNGDKVKVSIRFRGRQITKGEMGEDVMESFYEMVSDVAVKECPPKQEGRNMFMVLAPKNQNPSRRSKAFFPDQVRKNQARQGLQEPHSHQKEHQETSRSASDRLHRRGRTEEGPRADSV